jgi:hypothetical protein
MSYPASPAPSAPLREYPKTADAYELIEEVGKGVSATVRAPRKASVTFPPPRSQGHRRGQPALLATRSQPTALTDAKPNARRAGFAAYGHHNRIATVSGFSSAPISVQKPTAVHGLDHRNVRHCHIIIACRGCSGPLVPALRWDDSTHGLLWQVWRAKCVPFNEMVAIKVLNLDNHDTRVLVPPSLPAPVVLSVTPGGLWGLPHHISRVPVAAASLSPHTSHPCARLTYVRRDETAGRDAA